MVWLAISNFKKGVWLPVSWPTQTLLWQESPCIRLSFHSSFLHCLDINIIEWTTKYDGEVFVWLHISAFLICWTVFVIWFHCFSIFIGIWSGWIFCLFVIFTTVWYRRLRYRLSVPSEDVQIRDTRSFVQGILMKISDTIVKAKVL